MAGRWHATVFLALTLIFEATVFIIVTFTIIIYALILPYMAKEKLEERQGKLRAVVNSVTSMMDYYEKAVRKHYRFG